MGGGMRQQTHSVRQNGIDPALSGNVVEEFMLFFQRVLALKF